MVLVLCLSHVAMAGGGGGGGVPTSGLRLSPSEESRLGIAVEPVEESTQAGQRVYRGVLVAPGVAGGLPFAPVAAGTDAEAAARVATALATAVEATRIAEADLALATQELERATRLASGEAGSERRLDEARAGVARQEARVRGARSREALARGLVGSVRPHTWVRVSIYLGDRGELDLGGVATIRGLGHASEAIVVRPAEAPRTADPSTWTLDVYYDAAGYDGVLGEVVSVSVPEQVPHAARSVPRTAVVYDPRGVAWVYVRQEGGQYERVRVRVRSTEGDRCILDVGPAVGTSVVTDGAAELYGHDLGMGR